MTPSPYAELVKEWRDCRRCPLHLTRKRVVMARGSLPCDVLFVGEAPGESEDVLGSPFVGPAGKLLDRIVARAFRGFQVPGTEGAGYNSLRWAFCNLVGCVPKTEGGLKSGEPDDEAIEACKPRLVRLAELADPKLVVCVGKLSETWLEVGYKHTVQLHRVCSVCRSRQFKCRSGWTCRNGHEGSPASLVRRVAISHPAAILRNNVANQGLLIQKCVVTLMNAAEGLA